MEREIKFRGKRTKAGDPLERWIEGSLCRYTNIYDETVTRIMSPSGHMNDVRPETVGQFTGLKDKNGKESYFGDIVRFTPTVLNRFGSEYVDAAYKMLCWCIGNGHKKANKEGQK